MADIDNEKIDNCLQIVDIYWERIYLHIKIEGFVNENYKFVLYTKEGNVFHVKANETYGEIILNITNISNQHMLCNGKWHIAYLNPVYNENTSISEYDDEICKWIDIPVKMEACYKMKNMDKVFRYSGDSYAYIFTFSPVRELDKLICIINCTFMVKNISPQKRWFRCESIKISKIWLKRLIFWLEQFTNIVYQIISHLTPKNGKRILLMSETRDMGGNLKALDDRLKARELDREFQITYFFNKTLEQSKINIFISWMKLAFIAGNQDFIFVDDYVPFFKYINIHPKTKLIQVWHAGVGFKSVGYARFGENGSPYPFASSHRKYDYVIVGGEALRDVYAEVFGIDREKCLPYGLMRMDGYLNIQKIEKFKCEFYQKYNFLMNKKIILFAPTFRGNGQRTAYYPYSILDQDKIYNMCGDEYVFLIKMHPFIREKMEIDSIYQDRIMDFSTFPDINSLFYVTDILITDYSSNIYEFSVFNKPIVFFAYDKDEYELIRSVHRTLDENAPGKVCRTLDEVIQTIKNQDFDIEKVHRFVKENYDDSSGSACDKVIDNILLSN